MKNNKPKIIAVIGTAVILFIAFTAYSFRQEIQKKQLPTLGHVAPFTLTDADGKEFYSGARLDKRVWIANFIFTTCGDICPMMTKNMASLHRSFQIVDDVIMVSFSVNPEYDTPGILKKYAQEYEAKKNWYFLTGSREDITDVIVGSFKLGDIKEPIFHSSYFVLVDRNGIIRGYYEGTDQDKINTLFKDAAQLKKN